METAGGAVIGQGQDRRRLIGPVQGLFGLGRADQQAGTAIGDEIADLGGGIGGVQRQVDDPGLNRAGIKRQGGGRFADLDRHPVAGPQPRRAHRIGDARGQAQEPSIADRTALPVQERAGSVDMRPEQRVIERVRRLGHGRVARIAMGAAAAIEGMVGMIVHGFRS